MNTILTALHDALQAINDNDLESAKDGIETAIAIINAEYSWSGKEAS